MTASLQRVRRPVSSTPDRSPGNALGGPLRTRAPLDLLSVPCRIAARSQSSIVVLSPAEVWAFEARDRMCFVHSTRGEFDIDASLKDIEASPLASSFFRVHRNWLANTSHVRELELRGGRDCCLFVGHGAAIKGRGLRVPVSRERSARVRKMLLEGTVGLRMYRPS